jgi:hypothetical protein
MTDKRQEARLRHATHYVRVAQEHRTDLTQIALDLPNILKAGDFCVQLAKWNLLADLTDAINEYLLRGQWLDYIKLNSALVTNDLTELPDARIKRVHQLIELEENQGNYPQALEWNKFLIELQLSAGIQDTREVITALKRMAKLCQRHGKDQDAVDYLKDGLVFARKVEDKKMKLISCLNSQVFTRDKKILNQLYNIASWASGWHDLSATLLQNSTSWL